MNNILLVDSFSVTSPKTELQMDFLRKLFLRDPKENFKLFWCRSVLHFLQWCSAIEDLNYFSRQERVRFENFKNSDEKSLILDNANRWKFCFHRLPDQFLRIFKNSKRRVWKLSRRRPNPGSVLRRMVSRTFRVSARKSTQASVNPHKIFPDCHLKLKLPCIAQFPRLWSPWTRWTSV